ncbi:E3 ubiquitin-protein ligase TRIM36-like [Glandiceps talaboti]
MASYLRELICPVCDDYYTSPLVLPCQHNLCHKCAMKMVLTASSPDCDDVPASPATSSGLGSIFSSPASTPRTYGSASDLSFTSSKDVVFRSDQYSYENVDIRQSISPTLDLSKLHVRRSSGGSGTTSPPPSPMKSVTPLSPMSKALDEMERGEGSLEKLPIRRQSSGGRVSPGIQKRWSMGSIPVVNRRPSTPPCISYRHRSIDYGSPSMDEKLKLSPRRNSVLTISITMQGKTSPITEHMTQSHIYCPHCKKHVNLGESGINKLYRNFTLESIIEKYRRSARRGSMIPCQHCKSGKIAAATRTCSDCKDNYCTDCYKVHHPWGTPKARHEFTSVGVTRPKVIMCTEHPEERIGWYCDVCQRPTCRVCKLTGVHAGHKMYAIAATYARLKAKLQKQLQLLQQRKAEMESVVDDLKTAMEAIEVNAVEVEKSVNSGIEELQRRLEVKRLELIDVVHQAKAEKLAKPQERITALEVQLTEMGLLDYAKEVLKEEEHSCFVQSALPLAGRLGKVLQSCKRSPKPANVDVTFKCALDISFEKDVIKHMNFIEVPGTPSLSLESCRSCDSLVVEWDRPADDTIIDSYILEYRKVLENSVTVNDKGDAIIQESEDTNDWNIIYNIQNCFYNVNDLEADSEYCFRVKAGNDAGFGPYSKIVILKTEAAPYIKALPVITDLPTSLKREETGEPTEDPQLQPPPTTNLNGWVEST